MHTHAQTHRHWKLQWLCWADNTPHANTHAYKSPPVLPHTQALFHITNISALMVSVRVKPDRRRFTHGCPTNLLCKVSAAYISAEVGLGAWHWCWKHFSEVQVEVMAVDYTTVATCYLLTFHMCFESFRFPRQLCSKHRKLQYCKPNPLHL